MKTYPILSVLTLAFLIGCTSAQKTSDSPTLSFEKEDGVLMIKDGDRDLLGYHFETMYPPAGVDSSFKRSAFIHPLNSPHGQVLTRVQPPDHYHHYGIWNPWTHVLFEGDTLDFWNLAKKHGTVQFAEFDTLMTTSDEAMFRVKEEHVVFRDSANIVALNETKTIRISEVTEDAYVFDLQIDYQCASESPFLVLEYRYEGFGWRTTEEWNNQNSEVFTDQVDTRAEVDGTTGRWCVVQGELSNEYGGAVMMSHPSNFNHPEPLRVWPVDMYNRGDLFASFTTTKNTDWLFQPGNTYTLNYRLLVFNGKMTKEKAEAAWQKFSKSIN